jgi:hypothetical protein
MAFFKQPRHSLAERNAFLRFRFVSWESIVHTGASRHLIPRSIFFALRFAGPTDWPRFITRDGFKASGTAGHSGKLMQGSLKTGSIPYKKRNAAMCGGMKSQRIEGISMELFLNKPDSLYTSRPCVKHSRLGQYPHFHRPEAKITPLDVFHCW